MSQPSTTRTALQALPANPMNKRMMASGVSDSLPSLLCKKPEETPIFKGAGEKVEDALTPPITPSSSKHAINAGVDIKVVGEFVEDTNPTDADTVSQESSISEMSTTSFADTVPKPYLGTYEVHPNQPLGYGAWSTVCRASELHLPSDPTNQIPNSSRIVTPPSSPQSKTRSSNGILAIKSPSRRDARPILLHEARILTYLYRLSTASNYILGFHGWDAAKSSLVLTAYPQTLDQYARGIDTSLVGSTDPIMGRDAWASLVRSLVSALAFLHDANCVHGDIKPSNVLLSLEAPNSIQLLLADFSSSQIIPPDNDTSLIPEVSAITTEYTSPELLAAMLPKDPRRAVASFASDVYGLGVTLLETAAGQKPYTSAKGFMKLTMAREGRVLDFMSGESRRVGRGVRRMVSGACAGKADDRWSTGKWMEVVAEGWQD